MPLASALQVRGAETGDVRDAVDAQQRPVLTLGLVRLDPDAVALAVVDVGEAGRVGLRMELGARIRPHLSHLLEPVVDDFRSAAHGLVRHETDLLERGEEVCGRETVLLKELLEPLGIIRQILHSNLLRFA